MCRQFSASGFPANSGILRYVTVHNSLDLFFSYKRHIRDSSAFRACLSNSSIWHNFSVEMTSDSHNLTLVRGDQTGSFCPMNGTLSIVWPACESYFCAEGFDVSESLDLMKARVEALRLVNRFRYFFSCSSYDELFGLYIAMLGVFVTVCLGTSLLLFTDVVCPMIKSGHESWTPSLPRLPLSSANAAAVSPGNTGGGNGNISKGMAVAAKQGLRVGSGTVGCRDLLDIMLRCTVSLALGTTLGLGCVWVPFLISQNQSSSCGGLELPQSVSYCPVSGTL